MVSSQPSFWRSFNCSPARQDAGAWVRARGLVSGQSLFRSAQPGKACVKDGDAFRGSCRGRRTWRDGFGWRRKKGAPGPLVATVRSAAPRSQAA
jgi:hypothetical protein